jgi:peroxiredoxin
MARMDVNTVAPDFTLEDFNDEVFTLSRYKGEKHVLIVLNRGFV